MTESPFPVVLVVAASPAVRHLLEVVLAQHGLSVVSAADGEEALDAALLYRPDIVLLDFVLPGMRSDVFLATFRAVPGAAGVPVVVLSDMEGGLAARLTTGAQAYVGKPFDMHDLLGCIHAQLTERRSLGLP